MPLIHVARESAVGVVTINRADKRNAITREMIEDLIVAVNGFANDEDTRAVIFRGEGTDFSVGVDLKAVAPPGADKPSLLRRRRGAERGAALMRSIQDMAQPTICAIQGIATGAGACIASACDFRIAADNARIGYGEVRLGMNLMWNAAPLCLHLVGPSRAKQMIVSGRLFDAATLEKWGFVDTIAPEAELVATAHAWAEEYAALPPVAVQMTKRSVNQLAGALDRAIMHMDADQWLLANETNDAREAVAAFLEKRKPSFTGD
jgi:enoyl-CoA hydratase/carnithine racemase